jgi:ribosomal protein L18E
VHAHGFSKTARETIEAAGGTCQVLVGAQPPAAFADEG